MRGVCERAFELPPGWEGRLGTAMVANRTGEISPSGMIRGGLGKHGYGGIVNPPCNRKSGTGNPSPTVRAPEFYPDRQRHGRKTQKAPLFFTWERDCPRVRVSGRASCGGECPDKPPLGPLVRVLSGKSS